MGTNQSLIRMLAMTILGLLSYLPLVSGNMIIDMANSSGLCTATVADGRVYEFRLECFDAGHLVVSIRKFVAESNGQTVLISEDQSANYGGVWSVEGSVLSVRIDGERGRARLRPIAIVHENALLVEVGAEAQGVLAPFGGKTLLLLMKEKYEYPGQAGRAEENTPQRPVPVPKP